MHNYRGSSGMRAAILGTIMMAGMAGMSHFGATRSDYSDYSGLDIQKNVKGPNPKCKRKKKGNYFVYSPKKTK
jgi:hypothetical protein